MKSAFAQLELDVTQVPRGQISNFVRDLIRSGQIEPGTRLPSTRELARQWGTHVPVVHAALCSLEKEGLLIRRHGKGTFVQKRAAKLTCVGIYYTPDSWTKQSSDFQRAVHAALKEQLDRLGVRTQVWVDPRPLAEHTHEWTELRRAAEHREIQGLIVTAAHWSRLQWLNKLPIPSAHLTTASIPNKADSDLPQLAELSLRCLAEQGCRSVGLICPVACSPAGPQNAYEKFYECFTDLTSDLDLTVRNEWMRLRNAEQPTRGKMQERHEHYGYEEFLKLWDQPRRPEGLVVLPDTVARGVILGLREKQVRVPEELKLVISKNETIDLLCPMPATFLVSSEREFARALIEQVQKQFRGERCEPINVPFRLVAHPAAEQTRCGAHPAAEQTRCGAHRGSSQRRTNKHPNRARS